MNIADVIGPVDGYSAFVVLVIIGGGTIVTGISLLKPSNKKQDQDFELAKMQATFAADDRQKQREIEHETALAKIATSKEIEIKRIDNGMIDVKVTNGH